MFRRVLNLFRSRRIDDELRQELETHLACIEDEEIARGGAQDARRKARLRFGNAAAYQEQTRDADLATWLYDAWRDLKFASRQLLRNPGFAVSAVALLGLGIGVNGAIFTVISSVILRPLPLKQPDRLVAVLEKTDHFETPVSWPDLLDLRAGNHVFECAGASMGSSFVFRAGEEARNVTGGNVTPDYLTTLAVQPIAGRLFERTEGETAGNPVAMIREDFWRSALNADPEILRKPILVNGQATQVVGILPRTFAFPSADSVIWMPLIPKGPERNRGYHAMSMVGRLKPSVTLAQADADLEIVMRRLAREYPDQNAGRHARAVLFADWNLDHRLRDRLVVLQIAALALFLMACANVSSLLLARFSSRRGEFDIRLALGASGLRLIRQHLTESLLLTGVGCVAAIGLAVAGVRFLVWLYGDEMPRAAEISPDWRLLSAVVATAIAGALVLGLATAFHERRRAASVSVSGGSRLSEDRIGVFTRKMLVVFQVTCAVVLLSATGEVLRSFWHLLRVDVGFDRSHLITMRISLPSATYKSGAEVGDRFEKLAARVGTVAGVQSAAAINMLPVAEWGFNGGVNVEGLPEGPEQRGFFAEYRWVTRNYLRTMGIPLLRGRDFLPEEVEGSLKAAIINQTMARKLWKGRDPIGAHIRMFSPDWVTVVGIARDVRQSGVSVPASAEVYLPARGFVVAAPNWSMLVRSAVAPAVLLPALRNAVRSEEQEAAVDRVETMDDVVADSVAARRIVATLLLCFAGLALVLASLGLYSVVTFTVVARLPELAIRSAMGSTPGALVGMVGREGLVLVAVGLGIGLAGAVPLRSLLTRFVWDVGQLDAAVLSAVALILFGAGTMAVSIPALRAARIDPIRILRRE